MTNEREQKLKNIQEIIEKSHFLGDHFLEMAKEYDEKKLNQMAIFLSAFLATEEKLLPDQKKILVDTLETYSLGIEDIVRKTKKTLREKNEQDAQMSDSDLEKMIDQI